MTQGGPPDQAQEQSTASRRIAAASDRSARKPNWRPDSFLGPGNILSLFRSGSHRLSRADRRAPLRRERSPDLSPLPRSTEPSNCGIRRSPGDPLFPAVRAPRVSGGVATDRGGRTQLEAASTESPTPTGHMPQAALVKRQWNRPGTATGTRTPGEQRVLRQVPPQLQSQPGICGMPAWRLP